MVQYKAMESDARNEPIYRIPNTQLDAEIARMEELLTAIQSEGIPQDPRGYRLLWDPYFLKLCPRILFDPDSASLTHGMYIPLGKWKLLASSPELVGIHGGRGATFANVRRYFDNTTFILLVANAWIGTTPAQSVALEKAVRATLEAGRAVVLAVRTQEADTQDRLIDRQAFLNSVEGEEY